MEQATNTYTPITGMADSLCHSLETNDHTIVKRLNQATVFDILEANGFGALARDFGQANAQSIFHFSAENLFLGNDIRANGVAQSKAGDLFRRLCDIVISFSILMLLMPLGMLVATAVLLEDGGPVLYSQPRAGLHGSIFKFYKFRSMVRNADLIKIQLSDENEADGPIFKMKNDPRVTRVGRFIRAYSLDELPQLIHVLRGDMSIVGPRPLFAPESEQCDEISRQRHNVKPGLFCLREVCGRSRLTFDQWMALDLVYVKKRTLKTDIQICLKVIPAVLKADGAY